MTEEKKRFLTEEKKRFLTEVRTRLFDKGTSLPLWCKEHGFDERLARAALARHAMSPAPPKGLKSYSVLKALERETGMKICG
jgi:hypothetical protein